MKFKDIPVKYYPAYTWLWNGNITKNEIQRQIAEMHECGIRAFYIMGEPAHFAPHRRKTYLHPEYLSDEYLELLHYAYKVAEMKGMYVWLYDEGDYPSGMVCGELRRNHPELAMKMLKAEIIVQEANAPFWYSHNTISAFADGRRVKDGEKFLKDTEIKRYLYVDNDLDTGILRADNANLRCTEIYIAMTHERLLNKFGKDLGQNVKLMFDDEAYMGKWTEGFEKIFYDKYGYEIEDYMPFILEDKEPENTKEYRAKSDYIMLCGELVRENYFRPLRKWLNEHSMLSAGHLDNDNKTDGTIKNRYGNVMQILREFDVPGIDVIWSQIGYPEEGKCCKEGNQFFPRLASSAARQQGHSTCLSESFAVYGAQLTQELMRFVINYQAVRGISLFNFMAISYDRKTPVSLQFRPNFHCGNPGMDCQKKINQYTARLSYLLQNSKSDISTALYYPFRTICSGGQIGRDAVYAFEEMGNMLERAGVSFDLIDEDFVMSAHVCNGRLVGEYVSYNNIFVPQVSLEKDMVIEKMRNISQDICPDIICERYGVLGRKLVFEDGSKGYFVCNTSGDAISENITIQSEKIPYIIDLYTGDVMELKYNIYSGQIILPLRLLRGEGVMIWFPEKEPNQVQKIIQTEFYCHITKISSAITRRYEFSAEGGPCYRDSNSQEVSGLYEWEKDFSGEVTYVCDLPDLQDGEYILDLGEVRYHAKVFLNDNEVAEVTMAPYRILLHNAKSNDKVMIIVSNTMANACCNTDYFAMQDMREVGSYHCDMMKKEAEAPAGGLLGPIVLEKVI